MPRLTKADIEGRLLSGKQISWKDPSGKQASILLETKVQRRLFAYLLRSEVREAKGLPTDFIKGISVAFDSADDPATDAPVDLDGTLIGGPWKIAAVKIEGFGGVNSPKGRPFELALDGESLLIEGPNGSGKSSLTAAIIWGLTGERPRDQDRGNPDQERPVFNADDKEVGSWAPLATYPLGAADLKQGPAVNVEITLSDPAGTRAVVRRFFDGKETKFDSSIRLPSILLEAGLLMPSRLPHLRFDEGRGRLTEAVQKLTGLDDLVDIGTLVQGLCHKAREYLSYKAAELATATAAFDNQLEKARTALGPVSVVVPVFKPSETENASSNMAMLAACRT